MTTVQPAGSSRTTTTTKMTRCANPECPSSSSAAAAHEPELLLCAACGEVRYCGRPCQRRHWPAHRDACRRASAASESAALNAGAHHAKGAPAGAPAAVRHYVEVAPRDARARALALRVGLALPPAEEKGEGEGEGGGGLADFGGLMAPMRRLVVTGNDTPENLRLFFGDGNVDDIHEQCRISHYDRGCPTWAPRPASAKERESLQGVRDMQQVMRRW
ncbi:hypothetical protein GGR56DRAFT_668936 [Xylariaceae sp. FL0804]|nr:hypothetical protein GGR56DRAFT_668936 [Xylariaceae sp. FL0804]